MLRVSALSGATVAQWDAEEATELVRREEPATWAKKKAVFVGISGVFFFFFFNKPKQTKNILRAYPPKKGCWRFTVAATFIPLCFGFSLCRRAEISLPKVKALRLFLAQKLRRSRFRLRLLAGSHLVKEK